MRSFEMIKDVVERSVTSRTYDARDVEATAKQFSKRVGGFVVKPISASEHAVEQLDRSKTEALKYYRKNCDDLDLQLANRGVQPLCFVPARAWDAICKRSGLYQLIYNHDGRGACANLHALNTAIDVRGWPGTLFMWTFAAALIAVLAEFGTPVTSWLVQHSWDIAWSWVSLLVVAFGLWTVGSTLGYVLSSTWQTKRNLARLSPEKLIDILFGYGEKNGFVDVKLPEPPADVADVLWRFGGSVEVACVGDAIEFERVGLYDSIVAHRAYMRELAHDPIVYVRNQSAVAIIAQWGEFPIERAVVEECMRTAWR
jgi:hypothetical protein